MEVVQASGRSATPNRQWRAVDVERFPTADPERYFASGDDKPATAGRREL
jgi:hypothetical protein